MKIKKTILDENDKVYATCIGKNKDDFVFIGCSEGPGSARAITSRGVKNTIWSEIGGTMNFVAVPGTEDIYLATRNFIPVFQAAECTLNRVCYADGYWETQEITPFPYLHRFDVFMRNGTVYFFGSTLCQKKDFVQDWSTSGSVFVGKLSADYSEIIDLREIYTGITKNHGLWFQNDYGKHGAYFVSGVEGTFCFEIPNDPMGPWQISKVLADEVSDLALCDLDGNGNHAIAAILPFHGNTCNIYLKDVQGKYELDASWSIEFGHVVWGGVVAGKPGFLLGYRRNQMELSFISLFKKGVYIKQRIDVGTGPSQISVVQDGEKTMVLAANRQINQLALYEITS